MQSTAYQQTDEAASATSIRIGDHTLAGELWLPPKPVGIVVAADAHHDLVVPLRQPLLSASLAQSGLGMLLFNPLTSAELQAPHRVLDMPRLSLRIAQALAWLADQSDLGQLPVGLLGLRRATSVALHAAAMSPDRVFALVTHGGRPDLAGAHLRRVQTPTLLIMGDDDLGLLELGRYAAHVLPGTGRLEVMSGINPPGDRLLSQTAASLASRWFMQHLPCLPLPQACAAGPTPNAGAS